MTRAEATLSTTTRHETGDTRVAAATAPVAEVATLARHRPAPPVRIVHLGLGAFSRSHLAWYTALAEDADEWGIAAYTGRSTELATTLMEQGGLYTLTERSTDGDRSVVVSSIVRAHSGQDIIRLLSDLEAPELAIVTLTITEAAYHCTPQGVLDTANPMVIHDLGLLAESTTADPDAAEQLQTVIARLVLALQKRRLGGSGHVSLMSCDNIPDNGSMLRNVVLGMAATIPGLGDWCRENVSFVSTSVDRITPRLSGVELDELAKKLGDRAPVVAEPFSDWVIEGDFPAGRPSWETAGARFTTDLGPWEARKLWTLNGAHTILAAIGIYLGHRTVDQAANDPRCWGLVEDFWTEVAANLPSHVDVDAYQHAVRDRFLNARIEHQLEQINISASLKLSLRVVPVATREREAGRAAHGSARAVAAWMLVSGYDDARAALREVSETLAADEGFVTSVASARTQLARQYAS